MASPTYSERARARLGRTLELARSTGDIVRLAWAAHRLSVAVLGLTQVVRSLLPPANALLLALLIDRLAQLADPALAAVARQGLWLPLGGLLLLALLEQLLTPLQSFFNSELQRRLLLHVHATVYGKINSLNGLEPFESPQFQDTIQMAGQGAQFGPAQAVGLLSQLLGGLLSLLSYLALLLALNPLLALCLLISVLPQLVVQLRLSRQSVELAYDNTSRERRASYLGSLLVSPGFAKELRLFELAEHFLARLLGVYREINAAERRQQLREVRWQQLLALLGSLSAGAAFVLVVLGALSGRLSPGNVILYINAVSGVQLALAAIVFALANLHESLLFQRHYRQLLEIKEPLALPATPQPVPQLTSGIELRNVSFRYSPEHPWVLRNVNLRLPAGSSLALVGLNGAGKTTLVKLLTRCYDPSEGQIFWDGLDICQLDPRELRRRVAAIFQDFARYELSAYDNIALGDLSRYEDRGAVRAAARQSGAHKVINPLPHGYDTILSRWLADDDLGVELSGGQWQKVALARMFMRDASLLVLDEPSAALDAQSEHELYCHFVALMAGRTSLLISHRLGTVRMADQIAVLSGGAIIEQGTHAELLLAGGAYSELYHLQASQFQEALPSSF